MKECVFVKANPTDKSRPKMRCDGCGYEQEVLLPLPVDQFTDVLDGFRRRHVECKPKEKKRG